MIKIQICNGKQDVTINVMINWGATEDFIDYNFAMVQEIPRTKIIKPWDIYMVHGTVSKAGPITYMADLSMDIGNHKETRTFLVVRFGKHDVILGMPWLTNHQPLTQWRKKEITFDSERCETTCLDTPPHRLQNTRTMSCWGKFENLNSTYQYLRRTKASRQTTCQCLWRTTASRWTGRIRNQGWFKMSNLIG
jgi:hypothetical protein